MNLKFVSLTPGMKTQQTAKWARTMTKWLVTYNHRDGAKWNIAEFNGKNGCEARGIVDLIAIRKDHGSNKAGLKRGDLFELVLIQTKGGSAPRPTRQDVARLSRVAKYHNAKSVVLVEWQRKNKLAIFKLRKRQWEPADAVTIFG
jgi:hypothetical protein